MHACKAPDNLRYQMMKVQSSPHSPGSRRGREGERTSTAEAKTHPSTEGLGGWLGGMGVTAHQGAGQHRTQEIGRGRVRSVWIMRDRRG